MNGRIQELVEQAGFYMTEKNGQALAQFAELIVRECSDAVFRRDVHTEPIAHIYILKYFGLEP
jgi:hypothetical protein